MIRTLVAASAAALSLGTVALPAAAHAQAVTVADGTDDVWTQVQDPDTHEWSWVKDQVDNTDLVSTTVKHSKTTISVVGQYAALTKDDTMRPSFSSWFVLDDGRKGWLSIDVRKGKASTWLTVQKSKGGKWDKSLDCPDLVAKWHWDTDKVTASFPRSCYGNPKWLRFHGVAMGFHQDDSDGLMWVDNAHNDQKDTESFGKPVEPYTSKLQAG